MTEPIKVNLVAWCPWPFSRNLWHGKIPKQVSESGAPRNIDGMKFRKVWVIEVAVIKIRKYDVGNFKSIGIEIIDVAMRFVWIPGVKPVKVPARIPIKNENIVPNIK